MTIIESAVNWAKEVGELQQKYFSKEFNVKSKSSQFDLVSEVDEKSEKIIRSRINKAYPEHSILAEEGGSDNKESDYQWIVDPLDGTTNYIHSFPIFGVSLALAYQGEVIIGVAHFPLLKETYTAEKGEGAYVNDKAIKVAEENSISRAVVATGFPYDRKKSKNNNLDYFNSIFYQVGGIRRTGSAVYDLCAVARGIFDGFWEIKLNPWDTAAGGLIVKEAGGEFIDFTGNELEVKSEEIIAGNQYISSELQKIIKEVKKNGN